MFNFIQQGFIYFTHGVVFEIFKFTLVGLIEEGLILRSFDIQIAKKKKSDTLVRLKKKTFI